MSTLRARCPHCRTLTAVAIDDGYECHACGAAFAAGLVRVPRAWGDGGEAMADAARLELPWPEAAVVVEASLDAQVTGLAEVLPGRPFVLGGCCCSHVGAVRELARRHGRVGLVWFDAHGDLNTPESSPSGNAWGMPLRMLLDGGDVAARDVRLVGARNLDPPEQELIASAGIRSDLDELPEPLYVALDCDVLAPGELDVFMPEPGGSRLGELIGTLRSLPRPLGAGITGLVRSERNEALVPQLARALRM